MKLNTNHIKPTFAPETEFLVQTVYIFPEDGASEVQGPGATFEAFADIELPSRRRVGFSALND